MIEWRVNHFLISMSNKLFVVCGESNNTLEVFDSVNRKFTYLKNVTCPAFLNNNRLEGACCVGKTIIVIVVNDKREYTYFLYDTNY